MPSRAADGPAAAAPPRKRLTPEQMALLLEPSAAAKAGFRKQVQAALDRELTGTLDPETMHIQPHDDLFKFERQNTRGYYENISMFTAVDAYGNTSQWSQRVVGPRSFFPRSLHSKKRLLSEDPEEAAHDEAAHDEDARDEDDVDVKPEIAIDVDVEVQQHTPPRRKAAAANQVPRSPRKTRASLARERRASAAAYDEDNLDFDDASTEASHLGRTRNGGGAAAPTSMLGEARAGPAPVDGADEGRGKRRCSARMRARVGTVEFEGVRGGLEGLCVRGTAEPDVDRA
ncbi:hypothetical protein JCM3775_005503 [Rhodotorula graminis]